MLRSIILTHRYNGGRAKASLPKNVRWPLDRQLYPSAMYRHDNNKVAVRNAMAECVTLPVSMNAHEHPPPRLTCSTEILAPSNSSPKQSDAALKNRTHRHPSTPSVDPRRKEGETRLPHTQDNGSQLVTRN